MPSSIIFAADPLTAALNFLCTPVGQDLAKGMETLVTDIITAIHDLHAKPAAAKS